MRRNELFFIEILNNSCFVFLRPIIEKPKIEVNYFKEEHSNRFLNQPLQFPWRWKWNHRIISWKSLFSQFRDHFTMKLWNLIFSKFLCGNLKAQSRLFRAIQRLNLTQKILFSPNFIFILTRTVKETLASIRWLPIKKQIDAVEIDSFVFCLFLER